MLILINVFHIFQRFELPRQLSIKEIRTQEAVVVKYTFGKPRTSADWVRGVLIVFWRILDISYVTVIFSLIAAHLKKKTILIINDSSCRGHFWLYAHVHLDNKILSLVIHADMKVAACALQIFFDFFSAMVAAFMTLLNHRGKPFTVYINYLRLSFNKLIN